MKKIPSVSVILLGARGNPAVDLADIARIPLNPLYQWHFV
jgi:hypothetical protein